MWSCCITMLRGSRLGSAVCLYCRLYGLLGRGSSGLWLLSGGRLREYGFYSLFRAAPIGTVVLLGGQLCHLYQSKLYQ